MVSQHRAEDEDAPETHDDTGDCGERLDERGHGPAEQAWCELGEIERDADGERPRERQREERRDCSAEEEAAGSEELVPENRVPRDARDEAEPELLDGGTGTVDHLPGDEDDERERARRGETGNDLQSQVAEAN